MSSAPAVSSRLDSLFAAYRGVPQIYDELSASPGLVRSPWQKVAATLDALGPEELSMRAENARRVIREHGVTYNIYSDPQGMDRPWELDLIPLLISANEWRAIESGLVQ